MNSKVPSQAGTTLPPHGPWGVVIGRVVQSDNNLALANLLIEVVHIPRNQDGSNERGILRLGSTTTDQQGSFRIAYTLPTKYIMRLWRRSALILNIQLRILVPENPEKAYSSNEIYRSQVRYQAGSQEVFLVRLPVKLLEEAGYSPEPRSLPTERLAADTIKTYQEQAAKVEKAVNDAQAVKIEAVLERRQFFKDKVMPRLREELSATTDTERKSAGYVDVNGDVQAASLQVMKRDVARLASSEDIKKRIRLGGRFALTSKQAKALLGNSQEPVELSEDQVEKLLGRTLDKPPVLYRSALPPDICRPVTDGERCLEDLPQGPDETPREDGDENGGDGEPRDGLDEAGNMTGSNVDATIDGYVARLLERMTAPEDPVQFGSNPDEDAITSRKNRLQPGEVDQAVNALQIRPGPADVPAFYDFHDLQIAFEPVWQEALDDNYLKDVSAAYDRFVELGGEPAKKKFDNILQNFTGGIGFLFDNIFDLFGDIADTVDQSVPAQVAANVLISLEEWQALPVPLREELIAIASQIAELRTALIEAFDPDNMNLPDFLFTEFEKLIMAINNPDTITLRTQIRLLTGDCERILAHARRLILEREAKQPFQPNHTIITALKQRRKTSYPFRFFAANNKQRSVNFGLLVTYRQKWTPLVYQVGELVSTIPLAPKEIRKFSKKTVIKKSRYLNEIDTNSSSRSTESQETSRAEAEIVSRATAKTNFSQTVTGSVKIAEVADISATTTFGTDTEKHSESVKKEFREAVFKSAQEFKSERKVEVKTEEAFESEVVESGEIMNPNEELTVTFLFFELQRVFRVAEKIFRLRSVVLVAQEVPSPDAITDGWLIEHDWILNRVLLDDSFRPALTYVSTSLVSEDVALRSMREALFRQRKLVEELKEEVADRRSLAGLRYAALQRQIERTAQSSESDGGLFGLGDALGGIPLVGNAIEAGLSLFGGGDEGPSEAAQIRESAARDAFDRERREEEEMAARLQQSISTLEALHRQYTERLAAHLREITQVERLKLHIRQNIIPYMQAIWAHEPTDQRYLRLRNVPVPVFKKDKFFRKYLVPIQPDNIYFEAYAPGIHNYTVSTDSGIDPQETIDTKPLSEVADLDTPLGFKGNYMIFPLTESNPITEFMMDPYVTVAEADYNLSDPDLLGNITLEEFADYVCCLKEYFESKEEQEEDADDDSLDDVGDSSDPNSEPEETFEDLKPFLRATLKELLQSPLRDNDVVVVPTNSLYIEALPGSHPILEDFKLLHRAIDVKQAMETLRQSGMESLRHAKRILNDELEDPEIEKKIIVEGISNGLIVNPSDE